MTTRIAKRRLELSRMKEAKRIHMNDMDDQMRLLRMIPLRLMDLTFCRCVIQQIPMVLFTANDYKTACEVLDAVNPLPLCVPEKKMLDDCPIIPSKEVDLYHDKAGTVVVRLQQPDTYAGQNVRLEAWLEIGSVLIQVLVGLHSFQEAVVRNGWDHPDGFEEGSYWNVQYGKDETVKKRWPDVLPPHRLPVRAVWGMYGGDSGVWYLYNKQIKEA